MAERDCRTECPTIITLGILEVAFQGREPMTYDRTGAKTQEGSTEKTRVGRSIAEAIEQTQEVLRIAKQERLNVTILCSTLSESRSALAQSLTGSTFVGSLSEILKVGGRIEILCINDPNQDQPATSLISLISAAKEDRKKFPGTIAVCSSGAPDSKRQITHFCLARNRAGTSERSVLRIEEPHGSLSDNAGLDPKKPLRSVLFTSTNGSRTLSAQLLDAFQRLFATAKACVPDAGGQSVATQRKIATGH